MSTHEFNLDAGPRVLLAAILAPLMVGTVMAAAPGCAHLKSAARTLDDAADIACAIFGTEHPEEFKQLALSVLPPGAAGDAEAAGFDPRILCDIKEVVQPFLDDQMRMQASTAASLQRSAE